MSKNKTISRRDFLVVTSTAAALTTLPGPLQADTKTGQIMPSENAPLLPWAPHTIMTGRIFRLPVVSKREPDVDHSDFTEIDRRWSEHDQAWFYYLRAPLESGDYNLSVRNGKQLDTITIAVRTLAQLRHPFARNGVAWPRRWPLEQDLRSTKTRQTLINDPLPTTPNKEVVQWWGAQDDATLWRQLPNAEFPRAHYVNVHQGCPHCGTAIFKKHGYYPWTRQHTPANPFSTCPICASVYPSNDLRQNDFSSGDYVDDGFGYFDKEGHVFLFAASSHRELVSNYTGAIRTLGDHLRLHPSERQVARALTLMLLRWCSEEVYVGAVPQFRHGPSQEVEQAWEWGQPDWAGMADPVGALHRKGSLAYAIDIPGVTEALANAYDALWPFLHSDDEWVARARAQGLDLPDQKAGIQLVEEALSCLMQCAIDGGALSNKPRTSMGVLAVLRVLDRPDAADVMEWLYDYGPDRLRVFVSNNFTPDGAPPEANGGYNNTHTRGVFGLEYLVRQLRQLQPEAYPEQRFPSLTDNPRLKHLVYTPYQMILLGKIPFHFGDGASSGVQQSLRDQQRIEPLDVQTLERAVEYSPDPAIARLCENLRSQDYLRLGSTVHDGVGIAILRTDETPERAAAGIVYGDAPWHRHQDLLDVQLYAHDRPFLSDLGYPQSWAHVGSWEGNWATHNALWSVVEGIEPLELPFDTQFHFLKEIAGRGRLVRTLSADGVQLLEVEARRWVFDIETLQWHDPGVRYRRLLGLIETDGDGVALIDFSRIQGGNEHWRMCRGMEGAFSAEGVEPRPRPGTLAGEHIARGEHDHLDHPDHAGLAWMDEVYALDVGRRWRGQWVFAREDGIQLDLHQLQASPGTQLYKARATAVMGTPEQSRYCYSPLAWRRKPAPNDTTCIDLVFEPRVGPSMLASLEPIAALDETSAASGLSITTRGGRQISLWWSPQNGKEHKTHFADGTTLSGSLALLSDGKVRGAGANSLELAGSVYTFAQSHQVATINALDRNTYTIDISGLDQIHAGERITINATGGGQSYGVITANRLGPQRHRLQLDVGSILGRARIAAIAAAHLELDFFIITRTARLHHARLERDADHTWSAIAQAANRDADSTTIQLHEPLANVQIGDWVSAVAYVVGDPIHLQAERDGVPLG